jgi:hypothetical protein
LSFDNSFFQSLRSAAESQTSRAELDAAIAANILADMLPEQRALILDEYNRKAALCPRRSGKSHCGIGNAFYVGLTTPGSLIAIITLTAGSAQRIYWSTLLKFGRRYGLNLDRQGGINNTSLTITLENGSVIFLVGAATRGEIEKLRGNSYDLAIIDECKSFSAGVLQELIEEVLDPATSDSGGTILMIGTPGNVLAGPFYEATFAGYTRRDEETDTSYPVSRTFKAPEAYWSSTDHDHLPEWSFHSWTLADNTKVKDKFGRTPWENALRSKKQKRWADDNPKWRREALGQWATSDDVLVYAYGHILASDGEQACRATFHPQRGAEYNSWGLPKDLEWRYILGVDFGFEDDTALCVLAYSETSDTLYQVYDFKSKHMTASAVGEKLVSVQAEFGGKIEVMVCDGHDKQMIQDLNERYGLGLVPADKQHKQAHIELLNSDLYDGKFKVRRDSELAHEWLHLQWDLDAMTREEAIRRGKLLEDKRCANHLADSALYAHHYSIHYFAREKHKTVLAGSPEWQAEQRSLAMEAAVHRKRAAKTDWAGFAEFTADMERERAEQDYEDFRESIFN